MHIEPFECNACEPLGLALRHDLTSDEAGNEFTGTIEVLAPDY